jgi:hypothetical protein
MISASDPAGMVRAMEQAGYDTKLTTDAYGDPKIGTEFSGWSGSVIFYGCDKTTHDKCDSVQFSVGFDRKTPLPLTILNEMMRKERFTSMYLDDEDDPYLTWDILTANGMPTGLFMRTAKRFSEQVELVSDRVFEEERAPK